MGPRLISPFKQKPILLKIALYPLFLLYATIIRVRHFLFDKKVIKSTQFHFPIIVVGNLSLGGTGKTPFTAYLCDMLHKDYEIAVVSRGYKRKSAGFLEVDASSLSSTVGDEPYWLKGQFPNVSVIVGEDRVLSIAYLLQKKPFTEAIILDDAFQHRRLDANMNILLTDYSNVYVEDALLPLGTLRDQKKAVRRADLIVVTKCPSTITKKEQDKLIKALNPLDSQQVFFSYIVYGTPYSITNMKLKVTTFKNQNILLVTGIANPSHLINKLEGYASTNITPLIFPDHFDFSYEDIINIIVTFDKLPSPKVLVCTEKDAVKLKRFEHHWQHLPVFVIPIHLQLVDRASVFEDKIKSYIGSF